MEGVWPLERWCEGVGAEGVMTLGVMIESG